MGTKSELRIEIVRLHQELVEADQAKLRAEDRALTETARAADAEARASRLTVELAIANHRATEASSRARWLFTEALQWAEDRGHSGADD